MGFPCSPRDLPIYSYPFTIFHNEAENTKRSYGEETT